MARRKRNMEDDRAERMPGTDSHGDAAAGDEGVDDPARSRAQRDDMSTTQRHGDQLGEGPDREMHEDVTAGNRMQSQRSRRTQSRSNDERWDSAERFSGKGDQREGSERPEGTGYTRDSDSNTDDSSSENPLA